MALFERHEGRAHPDVAAALLALGGARELGDGWREALGHYRRADTIMRSYARLRDPDVRRLRVKAARALCGALRALGRYAEAEPHGRRAVLLAERYFGARDLELAGALNDLGMLRKYQGRYAEARPSTDARSRSCAAPGWAPARRSQHLSQPGRHRARARPRPDGEPLARRAVALRTRALGPAPPAVAADVAALAAIVEARGA